MIDVHSLAKNEGRAPSREQARGLGRNARRGDGESLWGQECRSLVNDVLPHLCMARTKDLTDLPTASSTQLCRQRNSSLLSGVPLYASLSSNGTIQEK